MNFLEIYNAYKQVESCQIQGLQSILAGVFGAKTDGTFVEVGAYDGISYSNTYQLAQLGWKGLYIEPIPHLYKKCVETHKNHKNIKVVNEFVAADYGSVDVYHTEGMYTGNIDFVNLFGNGECVLNVKCKPLNTILEENNFRHPLDLLVVDVEGHEYDVLSSFDFLRYMPTMVIVETHEYALNEKLRVHSQKIHRLLSNSIYIRIYADHINSIYVLEV